MEVALALGLPKSQASTVRETLEGLKALGLVKELPGSRWKAERKRAGHGPVVAPSGRGRQEPSARPAAVHVTRRSLEAFVASEDVPGTSIGWLSMTPRGFGFVTTDEGGEIFVGPRGLGPAMHGDRVRLRTRPTAKGQEGDVVQVITRGVLRVAGTLVKGRHGYEITLGDPRLPPFVHVEGALPMETRPGLEVVAQITRYAEREGDVPVARVLRVMGPRGSSAVELEKIRIREGVSEEFPADVVQEALAFPATVDREELARREDMRHLDLVTIDPKDARDHDDAVWAERRPDGFRIVVAIADVSFYVRENTAIDREALARGCSIYLPDRAIPMLPPELSSNLASLLPDEDRLMLGVEVMLSKQGAVKSYRFVEGAMRSRARITYEQAALALGLTENGERSEAAESRKPLLETLLDVSKLLRARRVKRGALGFELPEARIVLDERGEPVDVKVQKGDPGVKRAYELIEDLMLLANETVAEHLAKRGLPAIYRVHGRPDGSKLAQLATVADALGLPLENDEDPTPKELQHFLQRLEGTPLEQPVGYLLLRSMQQATYQIDDIGHFALAARHYLHFTSPIRRYPDLAVHRVVRAIVAAEQQREGAELDDTLRRKLAVQAVQSSRMERRAMLIERESQALHRAILMKQHVGEEMQGRISGVAEHGISVTLVSPFVETRVPIERVGDDYFELDRLGIALVGQRTGRRLALGDEVVVHIDEASIDRREVLSTLVSGGSGGRPRGRVRGERALTRRPAAVPFAGKTGTLPRRAEPDRVEPARVDAPVGRTPRSRRDELVEGTGRATPKASRAKAATTDAKPAKPAKPAKRVVKKGSTSRAERKAARTKK